MNCVCGKGATCLELVHNVCSVIMTNYFKVYHRLSEPENTAEYYLFVQIIVYFM